MAVARTVAVLGPVFGIRGRRPHSRTASFTLLFRPCRLPRRCPPCQALEEQLTSVASERAALVRLRTELEKAANRLEQERNAWEKTRVRPQGWGREGQGRKGREGKGKKGKGAGSWEAGWSGIVTHHQQTWAVAIPSGLELRGLGCPRVELWFSCGVPQAEEQARWEAHREAEEGRLRRDRRVLEKQSKALLKLPNKKERSAMEGGSGWAAGATGREGGSGRAAGEGGFRSRPRPQVQWSR